MATVITSLHILTGAIALVAGAIALSVTKGGRLHRKSGLIFVTAMLLMSASGAAIAAFVPVRVSVVAGMLTAIKSFVEDAFQRDNESLEMIQYGTYKIVIENFPNYYFAVAIKGSISTSEGGEIRDNIIDFIQNTDALHEPDRDGKKQERVSQVLDNQFIEPQRKKLKTNKIK